MNVIRIFNVFGLLVVLHLVWRRWRASRHRHSLRYPPGPKPKPLVGNLFDVPMATQWLTYNQWAQKYGDVVSFEALGQRFVILNSFEATRDLLERRSAIYSDRPESNIIKLMNCDWQMTLARYGERWRHERRILHQQMHSGVIGKYTGIQTERARVLVRQLLADPTNYEHTLHTVFAGTILKLFYGIDVKSKDDPYITTGEALMAFMQKAAVSGKYMVEYMGWLKHIPSWFPGAGFQQEAAEARRLEYKLRYEPMEYVKETAAGGEQINSVAHHMLEELEPENEEMEEVVRNTAGTVYLAAIDTTAAALSTFMLGLLVNPDTQKLAQAELRAVVGTDRLPTLEDRPRLPYIEAMMSESLRWLPAVPLALPHSNTQDDEYKGYFIPKGSIVMGNSWSILRDPEAYPDPDMFKPERFLKTNETGTVEYDKSVRDPRVACFGYGRRICVGRFLVEESFFITIATLLATVTISPVEDGNGSPQIPAVEVIDGLIASPKQFEFQIKPRSERAKGLLAQKA